MGAQQDMNVKIILRTDCPSQPGIDAYNGYILSNPLRWERDIENPPRFKVGAGPDPSHH